MSRCTDRQFEEMLHAYELDLLSDEQQRQFEIHTLECDACFERIEQFKKTARLMHRDDDIKGVVDRTDREANSVSPPAPAKPARSTWSKLVPLSLAAAAVLVLLIVQPWKIQITTDEVVAVENRLAVLYFENLADPTDSTSLAPVATNLLITDLAQSDAVKVVSTQRLYDIARQLECADPSELHRGFGRNVAEKSRSRWVLNGAIVRTTPRLSLTAELTDGLSGDIETTFEEIGDENDDIFTLVDRLGSDLRRYFQAGPEVVDNDPPVTQVTSTSLEAYQCYLDGVDQTEKMEYDRARASFQKALQLDPGFAMAYYHLSRLLDPSLIAKAVDNIDRAGRAEQFYIRARAARYRGDIPAAMEQLQRALELYPDEKGGWYQLGTYHQAAGRWAEAVEHYERAVDLDPLSKMAYNGLAYCYDNLGDVENAIRAIDKYVELAPDEPNPYDTKGEILSRNGRLAEAIAAFERALEINPDFHHSRAYLGYMYTFDGQYARADSCFKVLTFVEPASLRYAAEFYSVYPLLRQGKLKTAGESLEKSLELVSDPRVRRISASTESLIYRLLAAIEDELGNLDRAVEAMISACERTDELGTSNRISNHAYRMQLMLENKEQEQAARLLGEIKQATGDQADSLGYWLAVGWDALHRGATDSAIENLERAVVTSGDYFTRAILGHVYLTAGRFDDAIETYEQQLSEYTSPRAYHGIESVKTHYYLGQAYEALGERQKAAEQYALFLEIWKDADFSSTAIEDARQRLANLRQTP